MVVVIFFNIIFFFFFFLFFYKIFFFFFFGCFLLIFLLIFFLAILILFCYPRTGVPGGNPDIAAWDAIPGARGCTPQACSFRDHYGELMNDFNARIFGLSTQTPSTQYEAATRLHLPFPNFHSSVIQNLRLPKHSNCQRLSMTI
jgi:hypothetical protein